MDIRTHWRQQVLVIAPQGRLDTVTAPDFDAQVKLLLDAPATRVAIDCSALDYVSSAGLRSFLVVHKTLKEAGGALRFAGVTGNIREVLDICGLTKLFALDPTVAESVAALQA